MSYKITLKTSGLEYKAKGETLLEALDNLGMTWDKIKAKGVFIITEGNRKLEHLFPLGLLRKIFASKGFKTIWAKRLETLLK
jgi:hypothetical protein